MYSKRSNSSSFWSKFLSLEANFARSFWKASDYEGNQVANRKKGKLRNCLWPFYREGIVNFSQFRPEAYIVWVEPTLEMAGCEKLAWLSWEKPLLHLWRLMEVCISCRDVSFIFFFFFYCSITKFLFLLRNIS